MGPTIQFRPFVFETEMSFEKRKTPARAKVVQKFRKYNSVHKDVPPTKYSAATNPNRSNCINLGKFTYEGRKAIRENRKTCLLRLK